MSLVGSYSMASSYGHNTMAPTFAPEALYSTYSPHPSPPGGHQALYPGWGYSTGGYSYSPEQTTPTTPFQEYNIAGLAAGVVMGPVPGSPHEEYVIEMVDGCGRVVKRRSSANKKERRRTMSINNAFAELRECIPNVPVDTKLSKIKTLRLATSYIGYLMEVLHSEETATITHPESFKADVNNRNKQIMNNNNINNSQHKE
ncbi:unnamed protein product, partial [Meganyctiphanes norvegica]